MKQLVSILIPAFNAEKWIGKCIDSAVAQTWPEKEIIVVDDGSRDSTLEAARSFASSAIHVTTQKNSGASVARNHALSLAQGDYIQWLDADDFLAPDKIARQMEGAESGQESRILISGAWGRFSKAPEEALFIPDALWQDLVPVEWLFRKLDQNLWMAIESWLVSRKLTEMAGPWDESLYRDNDGEYFSRVVSCSLAIRFASDSRVFCRRGNIGISSNFAISNQKLDSLLTSHFLHINRLRRMEDSQRTRDACLKLLNRWAIYYYPERPDLLKKSQLLAHELGGRLNQPQLRPKYQWIQKLFGLKIAKKVQFSLPALRSIAKTKWERFGYTDNQENKNEDI